MNLHMNILINTIIHHYFLSSRCIIIFTDEFNTIDYTGNISVINVKIRTISEKLPTDIIFHYFGCQEIVVKSGRPLWIFKAFEHEIRFGLERFNKRKYLFVSGNNMTENVTDVFQLEELRHVSDVLVIEGYVQKVRSRREFLPNDDFMCNLWTHKYVGKSGHNKMLLLDKWFSKNQSFAYNKDLYPNKLRNQMGRELKLSTLKYEPYSILDDVVCFDADSNIQLSHGSELLTAITFASTLNMTPIAFDPDPDGYWGDIFDNWTGNGILGNIVTDKADVGLASLGAWEQYYRFLDLGKPTVRTGVTALVPAPKLAAGWLTPLYSYSQQMWAAVGTMFIVCILNLFFIHYFYGKTKFSQRHINAEKNAPILLDQSIFTILKLFVTQGVPAREIPTGYIGTYFMSLLLILSLFLSSTYSSGLSAVMTVPRYEKPIDTAKDLAASGIYWAGTQEAWITGITQVTESTYKTIVNNFLTIPEESLKEYSQAGKIGFAAEHLPHDNYAIGSFIGEDVIENYHLMAEDIYWIFTVFWTRKNSILLNLLDTFVLIASESGLITYWQDQAVLLYMNNNIIKAVKMESLAGNHVVEKLQWKHVEGAFGILCLGYIISLIVFLLEILKIKLKHSTLDTGYLPYNN